jgi:hypothetical protein
LSPAQQKTAGINPAAPRRGPTFDFSYQFDKEGTGNDVAELRAVRGLEPDILSLPTELGARDCLIAHWRAAGEAQPR